MHEVNSLHHQKKILAYNKRPVTIIQFLRAMHIDLFRNPFPTMEQFFTEDNRTWIENSLSIARANGFQETELEEVALKDVLASMQPHIVSASMNSEEQVMNMTSHFANLIRNHFLTLKLQKHGNSENGEIDFTDSGVLNIIMGELDKAFEVYEKERNKSQQTFDKERSTFVIHARNDKILPDTAINFIEKLNQSQFHNFLIALTRGGYQDHPTDPSMKLYIDDLHRRSGQPFVANEAMSQFLESVQTLAAEKFGHAELRQTDRPSSENVRGPLGRAVYGWGPSYFNW